MTTRNFDALFQPRSIALIGASNRPGSVGAVLARNLASGGFRGPIMSVNPHETAIGSTLSYRSVADLPLTPDLAVLATPPDTIPGLVAELGARGCRAAVVVTAGFGEGGKAAGDALRLEMLKAAQPHLMRIVGPNCLGFMSPHRGINASFAQIAPKPGDVAFLSQSGALVTAVLDWAGERDIGFSHIVSLGDMSDVDFGDLLDHLAQDEATRSILLYVESIREARKFMTAARIAARAKPVIAIKAGRSQSGAKAALSHTGALAGADAVYDAAFRRAGMLRVFELREIFEAAETLSRKLVVRGDRLTILTNGGGAGVLAADALEARGGRLAALSPDAKARLDAVLPVSWSQANPIDIIGDASGKRYADALGALIANPDEDAILVMNCPTGLVAPDEASTAVRQSLDGERRVPPILTCWLGEATAQVARRQFAEAGVPSFETPDDAVRAFMHLVDYRRNQDLLMETPPAGAAIAETDRRAARALVQHVLADGRSLLSEAESKILLAAYGIPVVETRVAKDAVEAVELSKAIGGPCALKILSPDITHKSDVGGVRLNLRDAAEVAAAAAAILRQVAIHAPKARIEGFTVEPMIVRLGARELIAGLIDDSVFGPVVLVGQGGTAVEVIADRALGLPPLNAVLARDMIERTRVAKQLKAYRDVPAADMAAIETALVRLADLATDLPEIAELDINPLLADANGVIALDARVLVRAVSADSQHRLAIRPYPIELETGIVLQNGRALRVRPIRPEDAPALMEMARRSTPEDMRLRFFSAVRAISPALAARLSQIDYDREMALVALDSPDNADAILGVVRLIGDPDNVQGELAIMVRSDFKGQGLGFELMREMLAWARARGMSKVVGDVLPENTVMLRMVRDFGARTEPLAPDGRIVRVTFDLTPRSDPRASAGFSSISAKSTAERGPSAAFRGSPRQARTRARGCGRRPPSPSGRSG
jgi:acetyltransferase